MEENTAVLDTEAPVADAPAADAPVASDEGNENDSTEDSSLAQLATDLGNAADNEFDAVPVKDEPEAKDDEKAKDDEPEEEKEPESVPELRTAFKGQKKEIRDLKERLEKKDSVQGELEPEIDFSAPLGEEPAAPAATEPPPAQVAPQPATPSISPEFAIKTLLRIENGDDGEEYREVALQRLQTASPTEILAVSEKAAAGDYGDDSKEIATIANTELTKANARFEGQKQDQAQVDVYQRQRAASDARVLKQVPDLANPESDAHKQFLADAKELNRFMPGYHAHAQAPEQVLWYQKMKADGGTGELVEVKQELAALKETIAKSKSPQSSSQPATHSSEKSALEQLDEDLGNSGDFD